MAAAAVACQNPTPMDWSHLIPRIERLLERLELALPEVAEPVDWESHPAACWRRGRLGGQFEPVRRVSLARLEDLLGIDRQKAALCQNTLQFLAGFPANHALLWGPRGTGKSTLVRALLNAFADQGLRLVEVGRDSLEDLPEVLDRLAHAGGRFVVYCDDLTFELADPGYKALKSVLDGSLAGPPENVLIFATSNRRHLLPEPASDNTGVTVTSTEIHFGEGVEERISLSERFGVWLSFHPFDQDQYLTMVRHWLQQLAPGEVFEHWRSEALRWALEHGSRSGRTARQCAADLAGRQALQTGPRLP